MWKPNIKLKSTPISPIQHLHSRFESPTHLQIDLCDQNQVNHLQWTKHS